jgi:hypothetical protein
VAVSARRCGLQPRHRVAAVSPLRRQEQLVPCSASLVG